MCGLSFMDITATAAAAVSQADFSDVLSTATSPHGMSELPSWKNT